MTIDEMIAVLQAAKDGKTIQINSRINKGYHGGWKDRTFEHWDFDDFDYRVKPEPREWWLCNGRDRDWWIVVQENHKTDNCGGEMIRVREVL